MKKGTLKVVEGDVTDPQLTYSNEVAIIPHCCNNLGVMGAGVAFALKKKWPGVEEAYKMQAMTLGAVSYAHVEGTKDENWVVVANMVGQHGTISQENPKPVKYWALSQAMMKVRLFCDENYGQKDVHPVIHCPKFGSNLAGGNFDFILELIKEIWIENGIDVVVYEFVSPEAKNRKKKDLWRTDITIWTDEDVSLLDLESLGREAQEGWAYCTKKRCAKVKDIYIEEPDNYEGLNDFFFGHEDEKV